MEEKLSLATILAVLRSTDYSDLEMVLLLLNAVESYKHFNEHQNNQIIRALQIVILNHQSKITYIYTDYLGQPRQANKMVNTFFGILARPSNDINRDPRFSKMTSFKQLKLLVKKMLAKLEIVRQESDLVV